VDDHRVKSAPERAAQSRRLADAAADQAGAGTGTQ
jgi:hypothetical protein